MCKLMLPLSGSMFISTLLIKRASAHVNDYSTVATDLLLFFGNRRELYYNVPQKQHFCGGCDKVTLALGVDAGGTRTRCIVLDERGSVRGTAVSGASKPDAVDFDLGRANLQQALLAACQDCGGSEAIDSIFLGMGSVFSEADQQVIGQMLDGVALRPDVPIGIDHDIRIALAGGTAGQPGIALIVGTGSSSYGRNSAGDSWRSGGWGYLIDDLG